MLQRLLMALSIGAALAVLVVLVIRTQSVLPPIWK
jgi:hypothetical protein